MRPKKYCRSEWNKIHGCQQNEQRHKGGTMQCEGICQLLTVSSVNITVSVKITFGGCKSCTSTQIIEKNALYSEIFYTAGIHFTWPLVATVMTNLNSECLVLFCFFSACSAKIFHAKCLVQRQKQDQSLSQQREFIGVTGNKIAEDKKSTRQLVLFHNKAACICSTTRHCLPTSLTTALPAVFTCPLQIWLNLGKIICDIT